MMVAFYYLLRVGEYTSQKWVTVNGVRTRATRTKQFTVGNVGFFQDGKVVPRSSSLKRLLQSDMATLKITNQKNGRMGETVSQHATGEDECPVKALAIIVHHILSHGGDSDTLLCSYFDKEVWHMVSSKHMVDTVRKVANTLKLQSSGIDLDLIGSHSLRAGGAMALKLHGYEDTTIKKMGRWTSLTFLQYIHNQIAHLSKDISKKMSMELPFINIAAIEQHK